MHIPDVWVVREIIREWTIVSGKEWQRQSMSGELMQYGLYQHVMGDWVMRNTISKRTPAIAMPSFNMISQSSMLKRNETTYISRGSSAELCIRW